MVYNWSKQLRRYLFPAHCRLCLAACPGELDLCPACCAELPWIEHGCRLCALPLAPEAGTDICPTCLDSAPPLDGCHALFSYAQPVSQWLQALKFNQALIYSRLLGELLARQLAGRHSTPLPWLVPVPLHRARLVRRGYNQSLEIARPLAALGYPLQPGLCRRRRRTSAQSELPADRRAGNIRNAFQATRPLDGLELLLVDDVMTTGATLNELARTLKKAGAARVEGCVIARTE
jgi:ComF family protein